MKKNKRKTHNYEKPKKNKKVKKQHKVPEKKVKEDEKEETFFSTLVGKLFVALMVVIIISGLMLGFGVIKNNKKADSGIYGVASANSIHMERTIDNFSNELY